MTNYIKEICKFFDTDFWKQNLIYMNDDNVAFLEAKVDTNIHPVSLEYLFREYFKLLGYEHKNIGHAIVNNTTGYIKMCASIGPLFNIVWEYNSDTLLEPKKNNPFTFWTKMETEDYLKQYTLRHLTVEDQDALNKYTQSDQWKTILERIDDPEIEHFHIYIKTDLHPYELANFFVCALAKDNHYAVAPVYYIPRPDNDTMWIGIVPDAVTSLEFVCNYTAGITIEQKKMSEEERKYGGEGWTISQLREFIQKDPYNIITLNELNIVLYEQKRKHAKSF